MDNYIKEMRIDLADWFKANPKDCEAMALGGDSASEVFDRLMVEDSITGNGSGSYCCCAAEALDAVKTSGVLFDAKFLGYTRDLDIDLNARLQQGAEVVDVLVRCCALSVLGIDGVRSIACNVMRV